MSSQNLPIPPIRIPTKRCKVGKGDARSRCDGPPPFSRGAGMKRLYVIGLALAAAFCAGRANTEELTGTLKKIKETGTISLGFRDSSIPFSYLDDNQKPIGFAMDICYKIVDA